MSSIPDPITIRTVEDIDELEAVHRLEREVWGGDDLVPVSVLRVMALEGGQVLLAWHADHEAPVGMAVAFIGRRHQEWYLHSHMVAVKAPFRRNAVGRLLKYQQLGYARALGLAYVGWTFDPLQRPNGQFNLNVLGAVAREFLPNFYGSLGDRINGEFATHRLFVEWNGCTTPRSASRFVVVPDDIGRLRKENPQSARAWAERHRKKWDRLLTQGFGAVEMVPGRWGVWCYRLQRISSEGTNRSEN